VARMGLSAVGALATYVTLVSVAVVVFVLVVIYPAAAFIGGVSLRDFARAAAPAQIVAISARSSLAALPALIDSARTKLHLPPEISGFFLPLASAMFRVGATLGLTTGAVFIGPYSAQAAGDYATGSNHVLPTSGAARFRGGLSAADFVRVMSVQRVTREGLERLAPTIVPLARAEGLEAHAESIEVRLK